MKIGFNVLNCGLGNNGGSRTVIRCAEAIDKIGHQSFLISDVDKFTWFKHKSSVKKIPSNLHAIVATGCHTIKSTLESNIRRKAWYVRGHETWAMPESELINYYKDKRLTIIVNSNGLKNKLNKLGINGVHVVHQGIDFDWWKDFNNRGEKIRIGCLYHSKHKTKRWKEFKRLQEILGHKKYEYVGFGSSRCEDNFLTTFKENPSLKELNRLYNTCHIWFCPTTSEGLHNVPMEAALCGCLIICSSNEDNGMIFDYSFDGKTAMVYEEGNIEQAAKLIENPNWDLIENMKEFLHKKIGSREENMKKFVHILSGFHQKQPL